MGIDFGSRRIGIAVSDGLRLVATPYETIKRVGDRRVEHGRIAELVETEQIAVVVVGVPYELSGDAGAAARLVRSETKGLRKVLAVPVATIDERLTTVSAHHCLDELGIDHRHRRDIVDQVAAAVILQTWIEANPVMG